MLATLTGDPSMEFQVVQIPTKQIKFFVRRSRGGAEFARLKKSIQEIGLKTPIGVRDISHLSRRARKRRQTSGAYYDYQLVYGQGRLQAFRDLRISHIPAVVIEIGEEEIVGRFLAENVMRRRLSWPEKAELIRFEVDCNGADIDDIAERFCITKLHVMKYLRILTGASDKVFARAKEDNFSLADTDKLATLPAVDQDVVIEVMDEDHLDKSAIKHVVDRAHELKKTGRRVTKDALSRALRGVEEQLRRCREKLRLRRFQYSIGPQHLFRLAEDAAFVKKLKSVDIELTHFTAN